MVLWRVFKKVAGMISANANKKTLDRPEIANNLKSVFDSFHAEKIFYCYWKSSLRLQSALAGNGDVDLLISRDHQHRAMRVLLMNGFKAFPAVSSREHPAVSSYLGYDEESGRLFHLHLHVRLVVGEPLLKNYRVPWEAVLLDRAQMHPELGVRHLDPAGEVLLLAVRDCLENSRLDPVSFRARRAITAKFDRDRKYLAACVDRNELHSLASSLVDDDFADLVGQYVDGGVAAKGQTEMGQRIRAFLAPYRSYNAFEARLRSVWRAALWGFGGANKFFIQAPRPWSRKVPGGGRVIALLGVDGSGKTTAMTTMRAWLGAEIDVMPIYFGTGEGRPSLILLPLKLLVPLASRFIKTKPKGSSHGNVSDKKPGALYTLLLTLWAVVLAIEKQQKLKAAHRGASRGLLVIADRYPQNENLDYNDGPLLARLDLVPQWARRFESKAYARARQLPPDLVIKLVATPETAFRREPTMRQDLVRARIAAVGRLTFPGARVVVIDAEQPLAEEMRAIKAEIWRIL